MQEKGFTLLELIISIAIIAVLSSIAVTVYSNWIKKISIENDTKKIFALLNEARAKAFAEKRVCGLLFNNRNVRLVCDTDMDNSITDETESIDEITLKNDFLKTKKLTTHAKFSNDGTASIWGTIYASDTSTNPNYSCITISTTRIRMGRWDGNNCISK